jgi:homoserine kinase
MVVNVQVPASTTNLGPGFDCLGISLQLWNWIKVEPDRSPGAPPEMASQAGELFFKCTGQTRFPFTFSMKGEVPQARGLGSSVTLRLGVLIALDRITNTGLSKQEICDLCAELEGHPDNAAAALFGGFTVFARSTRKVARFDVDPQLHFVLFIPDFEVKTADARQAVPSTFTRDDIVENLGNATMIAAALASGKYEYLQNAFADRLHQPFREKFVPFLPRVLRAGIEAGALGGFLSGSGSTVACVTLSDPERVGAALDRAAPEVHAKILIVSADNAGSRIV